MQARRAVKRNNSSKSGTLSYKLSNTCRVITVIKAWVKSHFYDFETDGDLSATLQKFILNTVSKDNPKASQSITKIMSRHSSERRNSDSVAPSSPFLEKRINLLNVDPTILANHMTTINFDM